MEKIDNTSTLMYPWRRLYQIVFYTTERGASLVDEFLDELDKKARAKVEAHLSLLETQ
jgi:hypothetical protein